MNSEDIYALHRLIDEYFEGNTSTDDERLLRRLLAADIWPDNDTQIQTARATLGYAMASRPKARIHRTIRRRERRYWAAAAITAVTVAAAATLFMAPWQKQSTAVIYAQGRAIHDVDYALATMRMQMAELNDGLADNGARDLLKEFGELWNE